SEPIAMPPVARYLPRSAGRCGHGASDVRHVQECYARKLESYNYLANLIPKEHSPLWKGLPHVRRPQWRSTPTRRRLARNPVSDVQTSRGVRDLHPGPSTGTQRDDAGDGL